MMVTSNVPILSYAFKLLLHHLFSKKKVENPSKSIKQMINTSVLKNETQTSDRKKRRKLNSHSYIKTQKKKALLKLMQIKILY